MLFIKKKFRNRKNRKFLKILEKPVKTDEDG